MSTVQQLDCTASKIKSKWGGVSKIDFKKSCFILCYNVIHSLKTYPQCCFDSFMVSTVKIF